MAQDNNKQKREFSFTSWLEDRALLAAQSIKDRIKPPTKETLDERLSYAVFTDEVLTARRAIRQGADVNALSSSSFSGAAKGVPLLNVACEHASAGMLELLIISGANIDKAEADGETALHVATTMMRDDHVKTLIKFGAGVNTVMKVAGTPLDVYEGSIFRRRGDDHPGIRAALNAAGAKKKADLLPGGLDDLFAIAEAGPLLDNVSAEQPADMVKRLSKLREDVGLEIDHEMTGASLTGEGPGPETTRLRAAYEPVTASRLSVLQECYANLPSGEARDGLKQILDKLSLPANASPDTGVTVGWALKRNTTP